MIRTIFGLEAAAMESMAIKMRTKMRILNLWHTPVKESSLFQMSIILEIINS